MESISREALDWSLSHIERFGDTDFFPVPFEFAAIRHCWDGVRNDLLALDLEKYKPHAPRRMAVPKAGGGFRIVSQLSPIDSLLYTAIVYEVCKQVESSRVPADRLIACSYRITPNADGSLFAERSGWPEFHNQTRALCDSGSFEYVLVADITDFYNQASQHRIENALESAGIPAQRAKIVEGFLLALAAKHSRGLPVGPAASIVLAEACLNDVDTYLLRHGLTHTRYVDDFRIFCRNYREAVTTLHDLCDYLYTAHRLAWNSSKTKILTLADFVHGELLDPEEEEERGRVDRINELIEAVMQSAGGYGAFEEIEDFEDLIDDESKNRAVRENLRELFQKAIDAGHLHLGIARHLLRRAAQLRTTAIHDVVMDNLPLLLPVLRDVSHYLKSTKSASKTKGTALVEFLTQHDLGTLPFCRLWGLETISAIPGMVSTDQAMQIAESSAKSVSDRCAALIARDAKYVDWVRERKENWSNFGPWERRAIIFAASALPRDERNSWLGVVEESGELLDRTVALYVRGTN